MSNLASPLIADAIAILKDATERRTLALLYRDFALEGEVERAMAVKERLAGDTRRLDPDLTRLASRYPAFQEIGRELALVDTAAELFR